MVLDEGDEILADTSPLLIILSPLMILPAMGMFVLGAGLAVGQEAHDQLMHLAGRK